MDECVAGAYGAQFGRGYTHSIKWLYTWCVELGRSSDGIMCTGKKMWRGVVDTTELFRISFVTTY